MNNPPVVVVLNKSLKTFLTILVCLFFYCKQSQPSVTRGAPLNPVPWELIVTLWLATIHAQSRFRWAAEGVPFPL